MEMSGMDAALLSAWRDPRERRTLFRLEQLLVDFMASSEVERNVSSQKLSNNFQRLLLHRLADRFGVSRETISNYDKQQLQTTLRLIKTEYSIVPSPLFIDIISEDDEATAATKDEVSPGFLEDTDTLPMLEQQLKSNSAVTNSTIITPKKKLMIMKRGTSKHNVTTPNSKENPPKSKQHRNLRGKNLSDKEKAYAEARARIFNDSTIEQQQQQLICNDDHAYLSHSNSTNTLLEEEQITSTAIPCSPTTLLQEEISSSSNSNVAATNNNSKISKVTWRNRKQEECDPDFQRRRSVSVLQQPQDSYVYTQQQYFYPTGYYGTVMESYYPINSGETFLQATSEPFYPSKGDQEEQYSVPQTMVASNTSDDTNGTDTTTSTAHHHPSFASSSYHTDFPALR